MNIRVDPMLAALIKLSKESEAVRSEIEPLYEAGNLFVTTFSNKTSIECHISDDALDVFYRYSEKVNGDKLIFFSG